MPVGFLTSAQRERYGRYPESLSADELGRYFHLDDDDREWIAGKRRDSSRLGYALQLTTARFLGTFLKDPTEVPGAVLQVLATQLDVADPTCVDAYHQSEQRWRHTTEIRDRYGYREFVDGRVQFVSGAGCAPCAGPAPIAPVHCSITPAAGWSVTRCCCPVSASWSALSPRCARGCSHACGACWCAMSPMRSGAAWTNCWRRSKAADSPGSIGCARGR